MKKLTILYIAFALCFSVFLLGCGMVRSFTQSTPPAKPKAPSTIINPNDLVDVEHKIKQAYFEEKSTLSGWNLTVDDVWIEDFYGVYNGYFAVLMFDSYIAPKEGGYINNEMEIVIDGVSFFYGPITSAEITLYKDSAFYSLRDVYNDGLLTKDDLNSIAYYQNEGMVFPVRTSKIPTGIKTIWDGNINDNFDDRNILIVIDKNYTNWRFYASDFKMVDVVKVQSLSVLRLMSRGALIDISNWRDIWCIEIGNPGKQNVINAIRELEKLPFIEYAGPNHFGYPGGIGQP